MSPILIVRPLAALALLAGPLRAMGEESFGNAAVAAQPGWPEGILPVVNDPHRVYRYWVNGNERFFFSGDAAAAGEALARFAAVKSDGKEVVLTPNSGTVRDFEGKRETRYAWSVHVPSGIYLAHAKGEKGTRVFAAHPSMTLHVGEGGVDLGKLRIPDGLPAIGPADLVARARDGLRSKDATIGGQAATLLGDLGTEPEAAKLLEKALGDPHEYVKRCAAGTLGKLGKGAEAALPSLRKCAKDDADANVRDACAKAVEAIEKAPPADEARARSAKEAGARIAAFLALRKKGGAAR